MSIKIRTFAILIFCINSSLLFSQQRNLLSGRYSGDFIKENVEGSSEYKPLPPCGDKAWNVIPESERDTIIREAEQYLGFDYPILKASVYLDFVRNGNRTRYQAVYSERRDALAALLMGEILENKGRFVDDIMNGVWTICEETSWTIPAHIGTQKAGSGLPDKDDPEVALFSAETASLMAAVDYFVGDKLDRVNPLVRKRLRDEVKVRMLDPLLTRNDYWWMGFSGRIPNNWNPWIVSNWLNAILVLEQDPQRRTEGIKKALLVLDQFLNPYPADGGCDEGPGYWGHAGASLFDCLNQLYTASNGKIDVFHNQLIKNIGDYIWKVYISGHWFVNFADAAPRLRPDASLMYRFGKATGSTNLMGFAKMMESSGNRRKPKPENYGLMIRTMPDYFTVPELSACTLTFDPGSENFLPDLQVFTAREIPGSTSGLFLAAKGGNNAESHNHNDVGNFVVYLNDRPLFLDAGVGTYTAKTFSPQRYEIWTMQSAYHNLPDINGVMQKDGPEYKAEDVSFQKSKNKPGFSLDISHAYPADAGILKAERSLQLNRSQHLIDIKDDMIFQKKGNQVTFHFITLYKPVLKSDRFIFTDPTTGNETAELLFPKGTEPKVEVITLEDRSLIHSWGKELYRINIRSEIPGDRASFSFHILRK